MSIWKLRHETQVSPRTRCSAPQPLSWGSHSHCLPFPPSFLWYWRTICLTIKKTTCPIKSSVYLDWSHCGAVAEACLLTLSWYKTCRACRSSSVFYHRDWERSINTFPVRLHVVSIYFSFIQEQRNTNTEKLWCQTVIQGNFSKFFLACGTIAPASLPRLHNQQLQKAVNLF